ncbi:FbpB family small basic protein [Bacillus taeanensis]|uniref:FbpB family small basic protein n=1 Tax=Bacillus taeanensis TaxID=273032 RepID=A0A366Y2S3_9BACI|nr:FbpB family small basic protein [Bacillus taeanensis]RBW70684.1 FbpB family small basic protein [Bacillus taeanensis]
MRKPIRIGFKQLVLENKKKLLEDDKALERIEKRIEERHEKETYSLANHS